MLLSLLLLTNTLLTSIFIMPSSGYLLYNSICKFCNYTKSTQIHLNVYDFNIIFILQPNFMFRNGYV